jgi:hypothetical protein
MYGADSLPFVVRPQEMMVMSSTTHQILVGQRLAWVHLAWLEQGCLRRPCGFGKSISGGRGKA